MGGFSAQVQNGQGGGKGGSSSGHVDEGFGVNPSQNQNQQAPQPLDGIQNGYFAQAPKSSGKGGGMQGQQGAVTYPATSGQQQMGSPNPYPNTIGMGDNQGNKPMSSGGKGKGA